MKTILEAQEDMVCRKYTQCYQVLILSKLFSHSNQSLSENGICHFLLSIGHNGWAANPTICTIMHAGLLGRWDKRLVDQASDVPSIFFFIISYRPRGKFSALKSKS